MPKPTLKPCPKCGRSWDGCHCMACFHRLRPGEQIAELRRQLTEAKASGYRACLCGALVAGVVDGPDAIACPECGSTEGVLIEAAWEANRRQLAEAHAATQEQVRVAFEYEQAWRQALVAAATAQAACAAMRLLVDRLDKQASMIGPHNKDCDCAFCEVRRGILNPGLPYAEAKQAVDLIEKLSAHYYGECGFTIVSPYDEVDCWTVCEETGPTLLACLEQAAHAAGVEQ